MGRQEKPLDPLAGPVAEFAVALRKLRQEAGGPTYAAMARRGPYSVATLSRAAAGDQLPTLPVVLAYVAACGGDPAEWEGRRRDAAERLALHDADEGEAAPYRGLARFEPADRQLFFGRDRLVDDLASLVAAHRIVTVFGPSGSGKSSLLRAGLVPRLRELPDPPAAIRLLTPGHRLPTGRAGILRPADGDGETWLVVDQFEEVFTLCHDADDRAGFIGALLAANDPGSRLRVVLGIRADFYARCLEHPGLAAAVRNASLPVARMTPAELRQAITKPAAAQGLTVERALTTRLLEEVSAQTSGLPLLSHVLLETWRRRRGRALTLEAYERAGGVRGAIAQTAEAAYGQLDPDQAATARRIMMRLIAPGDGSPDTRRPARRGELEGIGTDGAPAAVLELLARARLISLDGDTVELAHEALITAWPRLRAWIEEDREQLRLHRWLTEAAGAWDSLGREPGVLAPATRLAMLRAFATGTRRSELTSLEAEFLDASTAARNRTRRGRRTVRAVMSLLAVLAVLAGSLAWQQSRSEDRRRLVGAALRTAALADGLRRTDPATADRLSVAAWGLAETTETRAALLGSLEPRPRVLFDPVEGDTRGYRATLGQDGRTLTLQKGSRLERWDVGTGRRTASRELPGAPAVTPRVTDGRFDFMPVGLRVSPDGRSAVATEDGELRHDASPVPGEAHVWDVSTGERRTLRPGPRSSNFNSVGWAADSRSLVWNLDGTAELWDTSGGQRVFAAEGYPGARAAAVSPDGSRIALCGRDGRIEIWSVAERRKLPWGEPHDRWDPERQACGEDRLVFSPDGRKLAGRLDSGIMLIDVVTGGAGLMPTEQGVTGVVFSTGSAFIAAVRKGAVAVWRTEGSPTGGSVPSDLPVYVGVLPNENPTGLALDEAGRSLRYLGADGVTVSSIDLGPVLEPTWDRGMDDAFHIVPGGRQAIRGKQVGDSVEFGLYDLGTGTRLAPLPALGLDRRAAALVTGGFSPDGRLFAYALTHADGDRRTAHVWDVIERRPVAELTLPGQIWRVMDIVPHRRAGRLSVYANTGAVPGGLWDLASGTNRLPGTEAELVEIHPGGALAVLGDGSVRSLPSFEPVRRLNEHGIRALEFSRDGRFLAVADGTGRVTVRNGRGDRVLGVLSPESAADPSGRSATVGTMAFSADGRTLATGDVLGHVRLWDVETLKPLGGTLPASGDALRALAFGEDGLTLWRLGEHTPVRAYDLRPESIVAALCARAGGPLSRDQWKDRIPDVPYRSTCGAAAGRDRR
ncbi:H-X9-DG-CTERM domain-containing protein [Streptomyces sp. NPDC048603]|uniref:nSTAND1 domain-containing NTPase n=1 Tax=Streptomyces sp. NPDC048603 TaxID=3365577 RepID=UPI00372397A4